MRLLSRGTLAIVLAFTNLTCSVNVLENFADKDSDQAIYYDALDLMNKLNYQGAIDRLDKMTGTMAVDRKTKMLRASAYGGLCGLVFLPFVTYISTNIATTRLLPLLMSHFRAGTTTTKIDRCVTAETLIESIGVTADRTKDENMLLVLISFSKIGNILSFYADGNQDGATDAPYDVCTAAGAGVRTAGATMPEDDARELAWSIVSAINNITAVSSSVNLGNSSLASISSACTALGALNPAYNFCAVADKTLFTTNQLKGVRSIVKEDVNVGIDTLAAGCNGAVGTCNCP